MKYRMVIWVGSMENTSFLKAKVHIMKHFQREKRSKWQRKLRKHCLFNYAKDVENEVNVRECVLK